MIRTELRKWDKYEKKSEWKEFINSLSKEDYSIYQSYRGHRGNIVKVENKMNKLNNQLKELKETQNEYYKRLTKVNSKIDHLRKKFYVSPNVSYWDKGMDNDDNEYFTEDTTSFSLAPGEETALEVTFAPTEVGLQGGMLTIFSNDPGNPEVTVSLNGTGLIAPDISVSPDSLSADLNSGEIDTK